MKRWLIFVTVLFSATLIRAGDKPVKPTDEQIKAMLLKLADTRPAGRQQGRVELMGLPGDSLDDLRRVVTTVPAPAPAVVAGLHDVVCHLFLKREGYTAAESSVKNQPPTYVLGIPGPSYALNDDETVRSGYPITMLVPGLPNNQFLLPGDLVTGIYLDAKVPVTRPPNQVTSNWNQFKSGITRVAQSTGRSEVPVVEMQVIRGGETIRLKVPMTPKPADLDNDSASWETFLSARADRAERYWHSAFAVPLNVDRDD